MASKLSLFNAALTEIGHNTLTDTGEGVEAGRLLNAAYTRVVAEGLDAGSWNFATETIKATADTGVTPSFGYTEVFAKPPDWVRTVAVSEDEDFSLPLIHYYDDVNYWSANSSPIYIRYVSNDTGMGLELTRWTPAFTRFIELELAVRVAPRIAKGEVERVMVLRDKARRTALNRDAMNEPNPKFPPMGNWNRSRTAGSSGRDRGNGGSLTG